MPFPFRGETKELNEITRKEANSGAFIQLSDGITHYELSGSTSAPVIVLVNGFSVPYYIYDPTFEFLCKSGYCVLRYDLFGRGFSDRPDKAYNIDLFVRQLAELTDKLLHEGPLNLVGLSMGGPISTAFVTKYPQRVGKHILIDPCGARPIDTAIYLRAAKIPFLAELIFSLFGTDTLVKSIASDFFDPELVEQFQVRYKIQMQYKGFKFAILSTIRNNMLGNFMELYRSAGKLHKPTLLFWGRNDTTVPLEHSKDILSVMPEAQFHIIENCGHIPHYEKPDKVNPIVLYFLQESP